MALLLAVALLLRIVLWSHGVPEPDGGGTDAFETDGLAADRGYQRGLQVMAVIGALIGPLVVVVFALWWRARAERLSGRSPWLVGGVVGLSLQAAIWLVALPLGAARLAWTRSAGVGRQDVPSWFVDRLEALLIGGVILALLGALVAVAMVRLTRLWWLGFGVGFAALAVAVTLLAPVLIAPRFEHTHTLDDPTLRGDVRALADAASVTVDRIDVNDASTRTRALNARVEGFGATRRVVLYDTLVESVPRAEQRWVIAHELAHARHRHIEKGLVWVVALALPAALLIFAATRLLARERDLAARTAVALAGALVVWAALTPLATYVSRAYEAEADWTAIELTGDADAAVEFRRRTRELRRGDPDPPRLYQVWFGTHPTAAERVGLVWRWERERGGA